MTNGGSSIIPYNHSHSLGKVLRCSWPASLRDAGMFQDLPLTAQALHQFFPVHAPFLRNTITTADFFCVATSAKDEGDRWGSRNNRREQETAMRMDGTSHTQCVCRMGVGGREMLSNKPDFHSIRLAFELSQHCLRQSQGNSLQPASSKCLKGKY